MKWIGVLISIGFSVPMIVVQFKNPDVPETRLLIDHWKLFLSCTVGVLIGYCWFSWLDDVEKG